MNLVTIVEMPRFSQSSAMKLIKGKTINLHSTDFGESWEPDLLLVGFKNNLGKYEKVWIDARDTNYFE